MAELRHLVTWYLSRLGEVLGLRPFSASEQ